MKAFVAAVAALAIASGAVAAPMRGIYEVVEDRSDYYPVGSASGEAGLHLDYYVISHMSGRGRAAVLVNSAKLQIVEITSIDCPNRAMRLTFRMVCRDGRPLDTGGPAEEGAVAMLTPDAVGRTVDILCSGATPENALRNRSLADFR